MEIYISLQQKLPCNTYLMELSLRFFPKYFIISIIMITGVFFHHNFKVIADYLGKFCILLLHRTTLLFSLMLTVLHETERNGFHRIFSKEKSS